VSTNDNRFSGIITEKLENVAIANAL